MAWRGLRLVGTCPKFSLGMPYSMRELVVVADAESRRTAECYWKKAIFVQSDEAIESFPYGIAGV
jgi:hypothetical protein